MLLSSQKHMVLIKLCESILDANKKMCFVGVINEKGRVLESKNRSGVLGCLSNTKQEMFFMQYALRQMMRTEFDDDFGSVSYTYAGREKEALFSFPLDSLLVVVACHIGVNPVSFSRKIISIIDEYKVKMNERENIEAGLEIQQKILS